MSSPYPLPPNVSPQFCLSERLLKDFLRLSRSSIDDNVSTSLNALLTPSTTSPFNPASTSTIQTLRPSTRTPIPSNACAAFIQQVLLPTWQSRSDVLTYCASVATSPDPDDPALIEREVESRRERERIVDERLDPYSERSARGLYKREGRTERLAEVVRQERAVEGIVRARGWSVLLDRCMGLQAQRWEEGMDKWREETGKIEGGEGDLVGRSW